MPVRDVVRIDEERCDGCGDCVTACAEGAIAIVDGKARLISDVYCDGLGACLGHCPQGAITVIRRAAEDFDEEAVAKHLERQGRPPMHSSPQPAAGFPVIGQAVGGGCPGSRPIMRKVDSSGGEEPIGPVASQLRHWPVQLHLVPPTAPFFHGADVLLAADCVAFAVGDFHREHLANRSLAIACPKLDSNQEVYLDKLVAMIDQAEICSLRVMVMEVPCCSGLMRLAQEAARRTRREIPIEFLVVSTGGEILGAYPLAG